MPQFVCKDVSSAGDRQPLSDEDGFGIVIPNAVCIGVSAVHFGIGDLPNRDVIAERQDDTFGYAQFGAKAGIPLDMPSGMGEWTLNAGVSLLILGQNMRDYNEGDGHEFIATLGLAVDF